MIDEIIYWFQFDFKKIVDWLCIVVLVFDFKNLLKVNWLYFMEEVYRYVVIIG